MGMFASARVVRPHSHATTDYLVNAMDGQPVCVVNQVVDPGLIQAIEQDLLPEIERCVPA